MCPITSVSIKFEQPCYHVPPPHLFSAPAARGQGGAPRPSWVHRHPPPPSSIVDDGASLPSTSFYHRRWPSPHLGQPPSPNSTPPPPSLGNVVVPTVLCHYRSPLPLWDARPTTTAGLAHDRGMLDRAGHGFSVYLNLASICTRL
jgi:hypothetical protein